MFIILFPPHHHYSNISHTEHPSLPWGESLASHNPVPPPPWQHRAPGVNIWITDVCACFHMPFRWQDITGSVSRISWAIRSKHLFPHSPLLSGMADPLSRFTNQIHPELVGAKAWKQGILPAVEPVESAMCAPLLRWRLSRGLERSIANAHTDSHSNERRHFTPQRSTTSISQTSFCHPVYLYSHKNISKVCIIVQVRTEILFPRRTDEIMLLVSLSQAP